MRLGIDFGTTRTRVAAVLDGNYPLVSFQTESGDSQDWYPSLIATQGSRVLFGLEAQAVQYDSSWELCRSFKRLLNNGRPDSTMAVGEVELSLLGWLTKFLTSLRNDLLRHSTLEV